jgi:polysaccharide biosynthesis transport protein
MPLTPSKALNPQMIDARYAPRLAAMSRSSANPPGTTGSTLVDQLLRHIGSLILLSLLGIGLGLAYLALSKPTYTATSALFIDPRSRKVVADEVVTGAIGTDASLFESQLAIIRSDTILRRVIVAENLLADPDFVAPSKGVSFFSQIRETLTGPRPKIDEMTEALAGLARTLRVRRELNTYIVSVDATSNSPVKASKIANAVVQAYLDDQSTAKSDGASKVNSLIDSRLDELKQQVRRAENRMDEFKRANKIVTSEGGLLNEQQLTRLNTELVAVRTQLATSKARLDELTSTLKRGVSPESLPDAMTSGVIQKLRDQYASTARREASLSAQLQSRHPVLVDVRAQLNSVKQQIVAELQRITLATQSEYQIVSNREREIAAALKTSEAEVAKTNTAQIELRAFEREADASREILRAFLARAKETQEQQNLSIAEARVITPAVVPSRPTSPNPTLVLLLATLGGLGLGTARAVLWKPKDGHVPMTDASSQASTDYAPVKSQRLAATEAAKPIAPLPLLGAIAELPLRHRDGRPSRVFRHGASAPDPITIGDVLQAIASETTNGDAPFRDTVSQTLDAVLAMDDPLGRLIVLIGAEERGVGVTTVATALAYAAARRGVPTLLVDASSADPTLSQLFASDQPQTEPCVLDSKRHLQAILETDSRSGLALLPIALADLRTFSPDQHRRFMSGMTQLSGDYRLVIIDGGMVDADGALNGLADVATQVVSVTRNARAATTPPAWFSQLAVRPSQGHALLTMAATARVSVTHH